MTETKTYKTGIYKDDKTKAYSYRFRYGRDRITQKPYQEHKRGFSSLKAAESALILAKSKIQEMGGIADHQMSFAQFTQDIFMPDYYSRITLQLNDDQHYIFDEFLAYFGQKKPRDITIFDLTFYKNSLLSRHSPNSARKKFTLLHRIFKAAKNYGLLLEDLTERVGNIPAHRVEINFWTKEEFFQVIKALDLSDYLEHFVVTLLWLYYMTGLRVGEGLSLFWSENIDFKDQRIKIFNHLDYKSKTVWQRRTKLKTESSRRILSIDVTTVHILESWKLRQKKEGLETDFVLSCDGFPLSKHRIRALIITYANRTGIKIIQPKGLRHSHASLLINEYNTNPLLVQKRLGHSKIETTLNVYSHLYPNADRQLAEQLNQLFNKELLPFPLP
jgi:integrase